DPDAPGLEAAERVQAHSLRSHLVSALDNWASVRKSIAVNDKQKDKDWWQRPLLVASRVDRDPVGCKVREAVRSGRLKGLSELADSPDADHWPVATVMQLARTLYWATPRQSAMQERAIRLLKRAHAHQPDHFGLNIMLGSCLYYLPTPRNEEALSYLRVAA